MKPLITFLLLGAAMTAGCQRQPAATEEARPVRTVTVGQASAVAGLEFSGEVRARHEVALAFRVGGKLLQRAVDVGAMVKPGQLLARLDPQDLQLNAEAARAQTEAALAELEQLKLDLKRAQELLAKKFVSQAEVDRRQTAVTAAQRKLEQAQAQQRLADNQAAYASLQADAAGVVTSVDAEPGQVLAAGQPVIRLARDGEREVIIDVAEGQQAGLRLGQAAEISLWAQPDKVWPGKIREIAPAADPQARTYRVRVTLQADDPAVRLGMSAKVRLAAGPALAAASVPLSALFGEGEGHKVWLVDPASGRVRQAPVKLLGLGEGVARLEGLKDGDVVVTAGVQLLREGQTVRVSRPASQPGN